MKLITVLIASSILCVPTLSYSSEDIVKKSGCMICHSIDKKKMGPSFKDIASKYKGQSTAKDKLFAKVRSGGTGVWGSVQKPATPNDKISDADLKTAITWILQ